MVQVYQTTISVEAVYLELAVGNVIHKSCYGFQTSKFCDNVDALDARPEGPIGRRVEMVVVTDADPKGV